MEGHKDWPITFSSISHDDTLRSTGGQQAPPCKGPHGRPEDRAQMAKRLQPGSVNSVITGVPGPGGGGGGGGEAICRRAIYHPYLKQSPRSDPTVPST